MIKSIEVWANALLFLSSLVLLIDIAPTDLFPLHRARLQAVSVLKQRQNVLRAMPSTVRVRPETDGMSIATDAETASVLIQLIAARSALAFKVNWERAVGVGYATTSIPVAGRTLEAFHPLYVVLFPEKEDRFELMPVGQLQDLDAWIATDRLRWATRSAILLLTVGFGLQLWGAIFKTPR